MENENDATQRTSPSRPGTPPTGLEGFAAVSVLSTKPDADTTILPGCDQRSLAEEKNVLCLLQRFKAAVQRARDFRQPKRWPRYRKLAVRRLAFIGRLRCSA